MNTGDWFSASVLPCGGHFERGEYIVHGNAVRIVEKLTESIEMAFPLFKNYFPAKMH